MIIEQTVEIPADHRVFFEFLAPKEIPVGKARLELKVTPVREQEEEPIPKPSVLTDVLSGIPTPRADRLLGIAASLGDLSLEEIRSERLSKYL